jgi:Putative restriction endonuclease
MAMSTTAGWLDADDDLDPDTLKVPENPEHRRIVDAIGIVASRCLLPHTIVYRDMNWYPPDNGTAVAPDIMTLPVGALPLAAKSYRQSSSELPVPIVMVEVASPTDSFDGMRAKSVRCGALGVDVYIVSTDPLVGGAMRLSPGSTEFVNWTGKPINPLGGLSVEMTEGHVAVRTPEGMLISTDTDLLNMLAESRAAAETMAATAQAEAAEAKSRALELEGKLRALGIDP